MAFIDGSQKTDTSGSAKKMSAWCLHPNWRQNFWIKYFMTNKKTLVLIALNEKNNPERKTITKNFFMDLDFRVSVCVSVL